MMQTIGINASKILRLAKKGRVLCPECGEFLLMAKNPQNIPFTQEPASKIDQSEADLYGAKPQFSGKIKICSACGHEIREAAKFCDYCGAKQE
jgi:predicted RNA-binding Zn-ribbon protein involved in translation (DUF1610 family)